MDEEKKDISMPIGAKEQRIIKLCRGKMVSTIRGEKSTVVAGSFYHAGKTCKES